MTRLLFAATLLFVSSACATTGAVREHSKISAPLSSYESAAFEVGAADPSMTNAAKHTKSLRDAISTSLHSSGLFKNVYGAEQADQAKLLVKVRLLEVVDGSKDLMAGGVSRVKFEVDFLDRVKASSIGLLEIDGNSKKSGGSTSINGVNTDAMEDTVKRAIDNGAKALVEYLKKP